MKDKRKSQTTLLTKDEIQSIDKKYGEKLHRLMKEFEIEYSSLKKRIKEKILTS